MEPDRLAPLKHTLVQTSAVASASYLSANMTSHGKPLRICVVGAGPSGLTSARQMLDEGFEPVIFEKTETLGGLWAYREESVSGLASVMRSTVINTSKEMMAFR